MDRMSAFEAQDRGSNPLRDTMFNLKYFKNGNSISNRRE